MYKIGNNCVESVFFIFEVNKPALVVLFPCVDVCIPSIKVLFQMRSLDFPCFDAHFPCAEIHIPCFDVHNPCFDVHILCVESVNLCVELVFQIRIPFFLCVWPLTAEAAPHRGWFSPWLVSRPDTNA